MPVFLEATGAVQTNKWLRFEAPSLNICGVPMGYLCCVGFRSWDDPPRELRPIVASKQTTGLVLLSGW